MLDQNEPLFKHYLPNIKENKHNYKEQSSAERKIAKKRLARIKAKKKITHHVLTAPNKKLVSRHWSKATKWEL